MVLTQHGIKLYFRIATSEISIVRLSDSVNPNLQLWSFTLLALLIWPMAALLTELLNISYGCYGIALVLLTRYFRQTLPWWSVWLGFHGVWLWLMGLFQLMALPVPLLFGWVNGQRGPKARWFYLFYPGHLALLALIRIANQASGI